MVRHTTLWLMLTICSGIGVFAGEVKSATRCISPSDTQEVYTSCEIGSEMVYIRRVFIGKNLAIEDSSFCSVPHFNESTDCISHETYFTMSSGSSCNTFGKCTIRIRWQAPVCPDEYQGDTYVYAEYECLPKLNSKGDTISYLYPHSTNAYNDLFELGLVLSESYASWTALTPYRLSISVEDDVSVTVHILDIRGRYINDNGDCPFKLYLNDGTLENYYETCATFEWQKHSVTFPPGSKRVDIRRNYVLVACADNHHTTNNNSINHFINNSINNSLNYSINNSLNFSINNSLNFSINNSLNFSINNSLNYSINDTFHHTIVDTIDNSYDNTNHDAIHYAIYHSVYNTFDNSVNYTHHDIIKDPNYY
ncbi:hypothetical protein CAPTEDRAFT_218474 [Capitella teleta]|uniref:SUEL-type lectin domain-containing protein n=1 Tax=Capitella teleta TaxID=283909 RepID=R7VM17_CAPTE|nr:hypothetical protein CAPTEDRAFT_218474 [Capitella teleta]|eukprot:ELU18746.1 hypothetical protein CAPTEDRAFT_218474 [Capitella teleta]